MNPKPIEQQTRNVDAQGRIALGKEFANRTAIVHYQEDGEILIQLACVIPDQEAWLYQNEQALTLVQQGLREAQNGDFSTTVPNLEASLSFFAEIADEE